MFRDNKNLHSVNVGRLMKYIALELGCDDAFADEMFVLGFLHDLGYELSNPVGHSTKGGQLLKEQNYKYYKEVYYHGSIENLYNSFALILLNFADMQVDSKGNFVTFDERLKNISKRYGKDSSQFNNSKLIINNLLANDELFPLKLDKKKIKILNNKFKKEQHK